MADVYTRIGYIKGATGATGAQGEKGDTGDAATIEVGSVTTVPYGQTANVVNSGTEQAAIFDFTIPQGRPGQQVTEMDNLLLNSITTSAAEFPLPAVGETGKVLWGKVVKWFSDMAALVATKLNAANVVNNLTTTASGYALDARQGKALNDKIVNIETIALTGTFAGKMKCYKCGHLVTVVFNGTGLSSLTNNTIIAQGLPLIPDGSPSIYARDAYGSIVSIQQNGNFYLGTKASGDWLSGCVSYLSKE